MISLSLLLLSLEEVGRIDTTMNEIYCGVLSRLVDMYPTNYVPYIF